MVRVEDAREAIDEVLAAILDGIDKIPVPQYGGAYQEGFEEGLAEARRAIMIARSRVRGHRAPTPLHWGK